MRVANDRKDLEFLYVHTDYTRAQRNLGQDAKGQREIFHACEFRPMMHRHVA